MSVTTHGYGVVGSNCPNSAILVHVGGLRIRHMYLGNIFPRRVEIIVLRMSVCVLGGVMLSV